MPECNCVIFCRRSESCILGYRKKQTPTNRKKRGPSAKDPYFYKWKYLKKYVKNMVFVSTNNVELYTKLFELL